MVRKESAMEANANEAAEVLLRCMMGTNGDRGFWTDAREGPAHASSSMAKKHVGRGRFMSASIPTARTAVRRFTCEAKVEVRSD